jgi:hypothetical protein
MSRWFVRYLDVHTNRETASSHRETRDDAIALAREREREGCLVRSIVGPGGEEHWKAVSAASA